MEQYAAFLYTSTSVIKMLFYQENTTCSVKMTVYGSDGSVHVYASAFPYVRAQSFLGRRIYYSDAKGRYFAVVRLVRKGSVCYNQTDQFFIGEHY